MATDVTEGTLLWEPSEELRASSAMTRYLRRMEVETGRRFHSYDDLWRWSVEDLEGFWTSIWEFFGVRSAGERGPVLGSRAMPGTEWFPEATLNYAEQIFAGAAANRPAIMFQSEIQPLTEISWEELRRSVASVAASLREMGIRPGDRVVAYIPNIPEAAIAFLACASLGAVWSSCSTDFGTQSVIDRFMQIEPKVLFAVDGYRYNGKPFDRRSVVADLQAALPTLRHTVLVPYLDRGASPDGLRDGVLWDDLLGHDAELAFEPVPFGHPLWVLYSSGTTGLPKPIVQGHGGIVLEHLKALGLHLDLGPGDRFFWFTTTGWMMWNFLLSGLMLGSTILLYDGSPAHPDLDVLWEFVERTGMTCFGTSAGYLTSCMKAGITPARSHDLSALKSMGSTGSPLPPEGFAWVYEQVKHDLWLGSASGGTDLCSAFVGSCPLLPVHAGELQCRCLGADVQAWDEAGHELIDAVGELVIAQPMPSMPLFFWNDPEGRRYRESYFEMYPGVWRHGDWIKITRHGGVVIYGRSDSTINRMGVRMGSAEIYSAVEDLPEVVDSLVVGVELPGGGYSMPLFVVLREGTDLTDDLKARIKRHIRAKLTARHVPDEIHAIAAVPRTLNGKKLEVPVKKILLGMPVERAANRDGMSNPESIRFFVEFAQQPPFGQE